MNKISVNDIKHLGNEIGIEITDEESDWIIEYVNNALGRIDEVDQLPVDEDNDTNNRTWDDPVKNKNNAINVRCRVSREETHSSVLEGLTVGIKDNILVAGVPMTASSQTLASFIPATDSVVTERILDSGGVITAKTNLTEFAAAPESDETTPTKLTRNPHSDDHWAGGSSGGSASAVATDTVDVAIGTDTGGSIRGPAALSGIIGLKPTYGLVPLDGIIENSHTLDHVGPMASSIEHTARVLEVIAGKTERDSSSLQAAGRDRYRVGGYIDAVQNRSSIDDLTVGLLKNGYEKIVPAGIKGRTESAIKKLADRGVSVEHVSIAHFESQLPIKNILSNAELAAHWQARTAPYRRNDSVEETYQTAFADGSTERGHDLGVGYKSRLIAGAKITDEYKGRLYCRAQEARDLIREEYDRILEDVDVIVTPTCPTVAPRIEEVGSKKSHDDDIDGGYYLRGANIARLPAITLPNGTVDGLPVGLQLIGPSFREDKLLRLSKSIQPFLEAI